MKIGKLTIRKKDAGKIYVAGFVILLILVFTTGLPGLFGGTAGIRLNVKDGEGKTMTGNQAQCIRDIFGGDLETIYPDSNGDCVFSNLPCCASQPIKIRCVADATNQYQDMIPLTIFATTQRSWSLPRACGGGTSPQPFRQVCYGPKCNQRIYWQLDDGTIDFSLSLADCTGKDCSQSSTIAWCSGSCDPGDITTTIPVSTTIRPTTSIRPTTTVWTPTTTVWTPTTSIWFPTTTTPTTTTTVPTGFGEILEGLLPLIALGVFVILIVLVAAAVYLRKKG